MITHAGHQLLVARDKVLAPRGVWVQTFAYCFPCHRDSQRGIYPT
jgi:hypothetical protein